VLNQLYSIEKSIKPGNTIVIASSVSNGGGASVRAAEMDNHNLIDGVAVSEPNVNPVYNRHFSIVQGANSPLYAHSRSLLDYTSLVNVYQGCANLAPANSGAPFNFAPSADACASLFDKGLLHSTELAEQASEAQRIINDYGILTEQNLVQPSHWFVNVPQSISVTYANAYGRFSVVRNLCGYSFAAIDGSGQPAPLDTSVEAILFGTSNGIPPTGGIQLINNDSLGGSLENRLSLSPSTGRADQNLDGALCLRNLVAGTNRVDFFKSLRIRSGIAQVRATGRLKGKPSIFVTGRNDAILPPNHTSRAYFGLTRLLEGKRSNMHYYEVTNAHHLDAFNALAGFNDKFIPLHHYFLQAMDLMYAHLKFHQALPPSQVIHTTARGFNSEGVVPDLDETLHLPGIAMNPAESDLIFFRHRQVRIPE
jgi:hydroxybutyrate-dimer hydrolase